MMGYVRQLGQAGPTGPTVESSVVYPGDVAPGCSDPCAPCAVGTSLYDAALCGHDACSIGFPAFDLGQCASLLAARHQTALLVGAGGLVLLALLTGGRRRR
jgi:hypothetical protein